MKKISDLFEFFQGNWEISRESRKMSSGEINGEASGIASFVRAGEKELSYHEEGDAIYEGHEKKHSFFRDYRYCLGDEKVDIYHVGGQQDGEFYQSYTLDTNGKELKPVKMHSCGPDKYEGLYTLIDENRFTLQTNAYGPAKDNIITTYFQRLEQ